MTTPDPADRVARLDQTHAAVTAELNNLIDAAALTLLATSPEEAAYEWAGRAAASHPGKIATVFAAALIQLATLKNEADGHTALTLTLAALEPDPTPEQVTQARVKTVIDALTAVTHRTGIIAASYRNDYMWLTDAAPPYDRLTAGIWWNHTTARYHTKAFVGGWEIP